MQGMLGRWSAAPYYVHRSVKKSFWPERIHRRNVFPDNRKVISPLKLWELKALYCMLKTCVCVITSIDNTKRLSL